MHDGAPLLPAGLQQIPSQQQSPTTRLLTLLAYWQSSEGVLVLVHIFQKAMTRGQEGAPCNTHALLSSSAWLTWHVLVPPADHGRVCEGCHVPVAEGCTAI